MNKILLNLRTVRYLRPEQIYCLHQQAHWLERNLEKYFLANHYYKTCKAFLCAGRILQFDNFRTLRNYGGPGIGNSRL